MISCESLAKGIVNDVLNFRPKNKFVLVNKPPVPSKFEAAGPRLIFGGRNCNAWGKSKVAGVLADEYEYAPSFVGKEKAELSSKSQVDYLVDPAAAPRYYEVMLPWDIEGLTPQGIQIMNVTATIPKGNIDKVRAFCTGVAHNYFMYHRQKMQVKLCVVGNGQGPAVIDLDPAVGSSKLLDPTIIAGLMNSPAFKAMVSAVEADNLTDLMDRVAEYAGTELEEEKKAKYLEMVETLTSHGLGELGRFDRVAIWQMLTLKDRVMKAMMNIFQLGGFVKTPIAIDIPLASADNHVTPRALGWEAGCSTAKGLKPARPCNIPDLNLLAQEEEEATVGEEEHLDGINE